MKKFVWGFVIGIILIVCIPILVMGGGLFNIGASQKPGFVETRIGQWTVERSVAKRAPEMANPYAGDAEAVAEGLTHFRESCLQCHGAPGIDNEDFAKGLNPPAPSLVEELGNFTDGELFWITKHGIRMTGMPSFDETHNENEIWKIVAFVRTLPNLSQEQSQELASKARDWHDHEDTPPDQEDPSEEAEGGSHSN